MRDGIGGGERGSEGCVGQCKCSGVEEKYVEGAAADLRKGRAKGLAPPAPGLPTTLASSNLPEELKGHQRARFESLAHRLCSVRGRAAVPGGAKGTQPPQGLCRRPSPPAGVVWEQSLTSCALDFS